MTVIKYKGQMTKQEASAAKIRVETYQAGLTSGTPEYDQAQALIDRYNEILA